MSAEENAHVVCLRCGKLMPAEASFCNSCGADLSAPPAPGLQGAVSPAQFGTSHGTEETLQGGAVPEVAGDEAPAPYAVRAAAAYTYPRPPAAGAPGNYPALYGQRRTDGLAVASLACAIASFVLIPLLPAVAAIAMGFASRERVRKSGGTLVGEGMALAGILVGLANLVFLTVVLVIVVLLALPR